MCIVCGHKHLVPNCLEKKGKASVNIFYILPSKVGVRVVARAQHIVQNLNNNIRGINISQEEEDEEIDASLK